MVGTTNASGVRGSVTVPRHALPEEIDEGAAILATLRCSNGAGLVGSALSDLALIYDSHPPQPATLTFPTLTYSPRDDSWHGPPTAVTPVEIVGFADAGSGLRELRLCVGSVPEACDVWTDTHAVEDDNDEGVHSVMQLPSMLSGAVISTTATVN